VSAGRTPVAILISGRGSNMEALLSAMRGADYPAACVLVASNRPDAKGLATAAAQGIATAIVDHRTFGRDREAFERALDAEIRRSGAELVCLAGFMRVLTPWFIGRWDGRLLNIHPSLLPAFPGLDTHARALAAGVPEHGATVHLVVPEVDAGPILAQARVPVLPADDEAALAARVLAAEHLLYPQALADFIAGRSA